MRKILSTIFVSCIFATTMMAQEASAPAKKQYVPEEGDFGLSVSLNPILKYVGNAFNNSDNNSLESLGGEPFAKYQGRFKDKDLLPDVSIMGKYMLTDEWGLRANIGLNLGAIYDREYVQDDKAIAQNGLSEDKVIDQTKTTKNGVSIMVGGEYRKGEKRIQGVFGMGLLFALQNSKTIYTYGNEMTTVNQTPSTSSIGALNGTKRTLMTNGEGADVYTGITGSAGIEYFIAPKISLGAEVNLSAYYVFRSQRRSVYEEYNPQKEVIEEKTERIKPRSREFHLGTESIGGALTLNFYF